MAINELFNSKLVDLLPSDTVYSVDMCIVNVLQDYITVVVFCYSWVQQDPGEILQSVKDCIEQVCHQCKEKNVSLSTIKGTC